jgi:CRISPR/Cas system-associated exonuclease Cas4 (RecB family)
MTVLEVDPVPLSALQHWAYCPRQCALIHQEQAFADNVHTARGQAVHHLVDQPGVEVKAGVRVERSLPLWSERLGLIGKADLVEFHPDGTVLPVEFKHGRKRRARHDDINTLYVMTPNAYAHLDNATVRIEVERETQAARPAASHRRPGLLRQRAGLPGPDASLADEGSRWFCSTLRPLQGAVGGPVSGNILLRQAQHRPPLDPEFDT